MSEHAVAGTKFNDMGINAKIVFTIKLCLFLASFGFAFPTLLND